jgi:acetyl esterase/lipase
MRIALYILLICCICSTTLSAQEQKPKLVTWSEISSLPAPADGILIPYGVDSLQYGELRLPEGKGPFPVVVVVHGGCWLSDYNLTYMAHLSDALTKAGYATWNLEFRRVGNVGGGYPGTFLDVAKGTDYIRTLAKSYPINKKQVIVLGHSAGGHLALWLAARENLSRKSFLYTKNPLKVKGVVSLAGISDLDTYALEDGSCNKAVSKLMGGLPKDVSERYIQASPMLLAPLKIPVRMIQGDLDPIVPATQATRYAERAKRRDVDTRVTMVQNAGHFDLVAPHSPAWLNVLEAVQSIFTENK